MSIEESHSSANEGESHVVTLPSEVFYGTSRKGTTNVCFLSFKKASSCANKFNSANLKTMSVTIPNMPRSDKRAKSFSSISLHFALQKKASPRKKSLIDPLDKEEVPLDFDLYSDRNEYSLSEISSLELNDSQESH